jgi:integrase
VARGGIHRLTGADLKRKAPGMYADGGGLYLQVTAGKNHTNRSWCFRYTTGGRTREMGLGSAHTVGLAAARSEALEARQMRLKGLDPIEERRAKRNASAASDARSITFAECSDRYIEAHRAGWRSAKHAAQWPATLKVASETFGTLPVRAIDTALVMKVIEPIWMKTPETGNRLRGRIESILDWAIAREYRPGPNPARWRGHLSNLLPAHRKLRTKTHHPALPWQDVPRFLHDLRKRDDISARALEFLVLTAARTGEVLGATWDEVDLPQALWTVPAARIKAGREHRVPMVPRCVEILESQPRGGLLFPGRRGEPLWVNGFNHLMKQMGYTGATAHGFRSSFRDWCGEATNYPREIAEAALAHQVGSAVEQAYRRGDALAKRRQLMNAWSDYCSRPPRPTGATVSPIRAVP